MSYSSHKKVVPLAEEVWARGDRAWDRGRLDEAERLLRKAADMGYVSAMNSLATLLDDRLGHKQEAVIWYKRAVAAGDSTAAWNLAMHYIPLQQKRMYRYWMRKAAAMGDQDAIVEADKFASDPDYMTKLPLESGD